jgi:UDP-GlcNAc3NAcA epimerase
MEYLKSYAESMPVVLPVHPRTRKACERFDNDFDGLWTTDPLGYLEMTALVADAELVMTDSGGLQKEAFFHNVPCVTMRDATEWPETVEAGWNRLWRTADYGLRKSNVPFGDGAASGRIVETLAAAL